MRRTPFPPAPSFGRWIGDLALDQLRTVIKRLEETVEAGKVIPPEVVEQLRDDWEQLGHLIDWCSPAPALELPPDPPTDLERGLPL